MEVFFRESEASILDSSAQGLTPSGRSKSTTTAEKSCSVTSLERCDSQTFVNAESETCLMLTSSAEDSPVRTSAMRASEQALMENGVASGPNMRESFANYDLDSSSWRTSQLCFTGEWSEFSGTWPKHGMTRNGEAFGLPILGLCTEEKESSLLPTMRASMSLLGAPIWKRTPNRGNLEEIIAELHPHLIGQFLNVQAGEWLMGFPLGWTDLEDSAMPSSRKSLNGSEEK